MFFFKLRTPLELQVAALLQGSDHVIQKDQEMSPAEERALRAMDVEEVGRICWNCYKAVIQKDQEMSPAEERALRAMDVEEVERIFWNCYKAVIM